MYTYSIALLPGRKEFVMKRTLTICGIVVLLAGGVILSGMLNRKGEVRLSARFRVEFEEGAADDWYPCLIAQLPANESEIEEVVHGDLQAVLKAPGYAVFQPLVLQFREEKVPEAIIDWHKRILNRKETAELETHDAVLQILDSAGALQSTFRFFEAWPSKVCGLKTVRSGFRGEVVEEICFQFHRYQLESAAALKGAGR